MSENLPEFTARVPAKINLSLAVTGKRGNLHTLDMIVCPYDRLADTARFCPAEKSDHPKIELTELSASFAGFDPDRFREFFLPKLNAVALETRVSGSLSLELDIPLGAGLGGSSAATVATVKAVENCLMSEGKATKISNEFLLSLGSDVPCMYAGGVLRVTGVGEILAPLPDPAPQNIRVFIPNCTSDSAACYALYDKFSAQGKLPLPPRIPESVSEALELKRNDLTVPATALRPEIGQMLAALRAEYDDAFVLMSGSGSACVACIC